MVAKNKIKVPLKKVYQSCIKKPVETPNPPSPHQKGLSESSTTRGLF